MRKNKNVYIYIPGVQLGEIFFNFKSEDLIVRNFFIPDWWIPFDYDLSEVLYKNSNEELSVYFSESENQIVSIQCFGLISFKGIILNNLTADEIVNIFGVPNEIDTEFGAWFTETEQETIYNYDNYGCMMIFLRHDKFYSISISTIKADDE